MGLKLNKIMKEHIIKEQKECISKILEFLDMENQQNNLKYLVDFDFSKLRERDYRYGKFRAERDEDSFWLTKYINFYIFNCRLPKLETLNEMNENYGGDTINPVRKSTKYLTIGNFMLLPKGSHNGHTTFNTFRYSCYKDDFYKFIIKIKEIYNVLTKKQNKNDWLQEDINNETWLKIAEHNKFYFSAIKEFKDFLKINFIENYALLKVNDILNINKNELSNIEKFIQKRSELIFENINNIIP